MNDLINNAPEEDVVQIEDKSQTIEEFANESIQEDDEKDDFENILESIKDEEITYESEEEKKENF